MPLHDPGDHTIRERKDSMNSRPLMLLHTADDPCHNSATALYEFLAELEAYCPPE